MAASREAHTRHARGIGGGREKRERRVRNEEAVRELRVQAGGGVSLQNREGVLKI